MIKIAVDEIHRHIMALKVVHINKGRIDFEAEAEALWLNVLKPKWEAQARRLADEVLAELRAGKVPPPTPQEQKVSRKKQK